MGIRRALTGAVLGLAGSALLALPAAAAVPADPYGPDPTPGNLGTSSTIVEPGEAVTVSGGGFAPGSTVTITVTVTGSGFGRVATDSAPAPMGSLRAAGRTRAVAGQVRSFAAQTVTANAAGSFTASVRLTQEGTNVITASGVDPAGNTRTLTTVVFVTAVGGVGGIGDDDPGSGGGDGSGDGSGVGGGDGGGDGSGIGGGDASGVGGGAGLPDTGADLTVPGIVGGVLVLLGGGALVVGRRRGREKVGA